MEYGGKMKKQFQRFRQQGLEIIGRGDKSDELTENLMEIERKVEGIRNGCYVIIKKLAATIQGSGSSLEKHQKKLPQHSLGSGMMEAGTQLGHGSLFGAVLEMVGQTQMDTAQQQAHYEITVSHDVITQLSSMMEEDMKKIEKSKKKLHGARLDMDTAKSRLKSMEHQSSSREYPMGKLETLRSHVDSASKKFEVCQDAYATDMFSLLSKEQVYTEKLKQLVLQQLNFHKTAVVSLDAMLPALEKRMNETQDRPVFGCSLEDHLRVYKREIAVVLEECIIALRENWMDTEGLFRIAASSAKTKFLKSAFNAGQRDLSNHDPHTIAGCLKMYLRELPEPLLTYKLYPEWIKAAGLGDYNERVQALWSVKENLPEPNCKNFKYLLGFLNEFAQYQEVTKMNTGNIAIVIGPNLLWPREEITDAAGLVTDTALQRRVVETFIEHCRWFFTDIPEPPPPNITKLPVSPSPYTIDTPPSPSQPSPTSTGLGTPPPKPKETHESPTFAHKPALQHALIGPTVQLTGIALESGSNDKQEPTQTHQAVIRTGSNSTFQTQPPQAPPRSSSTSTSQTQPPQAPPRSSSTSTSQTQPPQPAPRSGSTSSSQTHPTPAQKPVPPPRPTGNPPSPLTKRATPPAIYPKPRPNSQDSSPPATRTISSDLNPFSSSNGRTGSASSLQESGHDDTGLPPNFTSTPSTRPLFQVGDSTPPPEQPRPIPPARSKKPAAKPSTLERKPTRGPSRPAPPPPANKRPSYPDLKPSLRSLDSQEEVSAL